MCDPPALYNEQEGLTARSVTGDKLAVEDQ